MGPCMLKKIKSDKYTHHIQKVQKGGENNGKEIALVPYSGEATRKDNLGGNGNFYESEEHITAQVKGVH